MHGTVPADNGPGGSIPVERAAEQSTQVPALWRQTHTGWTVCFSLHHLTYIFTLSNSFSFFASNSSVFVFLMAPLTMKWTLVRDSVGREEASAYRQSWKCIRQLLLYAYETWSLGPLPASCKEVEPLPQCVPESCWTSDCRIRFLTQRYWTSWFTWHLHHPYAISVKMCGSCYSPARQTSSKKTFPRWATGKQTFTQCTEETFQGQLAVILDQAFLLYISSANK